MARMKIAKTLIVGALLCVPALSLVGRLARCRAGRLPFPRRRSMRRLPPTAAANRGAGWALLRGIQAVYGIQASPGGCRIFRPQQGNRFITNVERNGPDMPIRFRSLTIRGRFRSGKSSNLFLGRAQSDRTQLSGTHRLSSPIFYSNTTQKRIADATSRSLSRRMSSAPRS